MIRVYLGGLIRPDHFEDFEGIAIPVGIYQPDQEWRNQFKLDVLRLEHDRIVCIDPLDGFINGTEILWDASEQEIVWQCIDKLNICDLMVANLVVRDSDLDKSIGTVKEMTYARWVKRIPVITVADRKYYSENCWIRFESTYIVDGVEKVLPLIEEKYLW